MSFSEAMLNVLYNHPGVNKVLIIFSDGVEKDLYSDLELGKMLLLTSMDPKVLNAAIIHGGSEKDQMYVIFLADLTHIEFYSKDKAVRKTLVEKAKANKPEDSSK